MVRKSIAAAVLLMIPAVVLARAAGQQVIGGLAGGITVNGQPIPNPQPGTPQGTRPLRTGTSRISGRIVASTGQILRQATVLVGATELGGSVSATTDNEGRYEIGNLPAGRYAVNALKPNYINLSYGQSAPGDLERTVVLAEGQHLDRIDIALPRAGVIAGRVLDEYGEAVIDAQVTVMVRRVAQGQLVMRPVGRSAMTNDIGEYRVFGLSPGQYYVSSSNRIPGLGSVARTAYAPTYYPNATTTGNAQPVAVGLGDTVAGVDVQLQMVRLAVISGTTADGQGKPLMGGSVSAIDRNGGGSSSSGGIVRQDGSFTLPPLPPGEYLVRASQPPPPPAPPPPTQGTAPSVPRPIVETFVASVTLSGDDVSGVVLTPLKRVTVSGRVVFSGTNQRPRNPPIRLTLMPKGTDATLGLVQPPATAVGPSLALQFQVPAAAILIRAFTTNSEWDVKTIRVGGIDITDTGLDFRGGRDVDDLEVELTDKPQEVSGTITDAQGNALSTSILVFPEDRDRWIFDSRLISSTRTDASGQYKIRTLPPGRYLAAATSASQGTLAMQDPDELEALRRRATPFSLLEGETKTLNLRVPSGR